MLENVGRKVFLILLLVALSLGFLLLKPTIAVVTNIDREHMDYYGTFERLVDAYLEFINGVPFYGRVVLCTDDAEIAGTAGEGRGGE